MPKHLLTTAVAAIALLVMSAQTHAEKVDPIVGYVLEKVVVSPKYTDMVVPSLIVADSLGGQLKVTLPGKSCSEEYIFSWKFEKDLGYLSAKEDFTITMTAGASSCDSDRNDKIQTSAGAITKPNLEKLELERGVRGGMIPVAPEPSVWAKNWGKPNEFAKFGSGTTKYQADHKKDHSHLFFSVTPAAYRSGTKGSEYQIVYQYRVVRASTQAGDVKILLEQAGEKSPITATIPPVDKR